MDIKTRIEQLKKEKNAIILAHYYCNEEVQQIADEIGDSFYLAKIAKNTDADRIIFAGVSFMGESAKILNPDKKVYMPDLSADCPMAHMITKEKIEEVKKTYPGISVVCYINSTAEIKTYSDVCVTSSNALKIIEKLPGDQVFFIPDGNLGRYVQKQVKNKQVILNDGYCPRHHVISEEDVNDAKNRYPNALFVAHPECKQEVLNHADFIGSTSEIIHYIIESECKEFIVGTVDGILPSIVKQTPDKVLHHVIYEQTCPDMLKNTLEKILDVLENETNEVQVSDEKRIQALKPLDRMLELAK